MQKTKKAPKKVATASKSFAADRSKDASTSKPQKPAKKPSVAVQAAKKAPTSVKKTVVVKKAASVKKAAPPKKEAAKAVAKGAVKEPVKKAPVAKPAAKVGVSKDPKKKVVAVKAPPPELKKEAPKGERKYAKKPAPKPEIEIDPADDVLDSDDLDVGGDEIIEEKAPASKASASKARKAEPEKEASGDDEVFLTDAEGRRYCRVRDCDQIASVDGGYCRYHYLLYWRNIQNRKKILSEGKLERYIEELTARYPDKYLELLRKDLRSEKDFMSAIQELEIDESSNDSEFEDEAQSYLDEVRGMGSEPSNDREEDF